MVDYSFREAPCSKGKERDGETHIPSVGEHDREVEGSGIKSPYLRKEEDKKPTPQHDKKSPESNVPKLSYYKLLIYYGGKDQAGGGDVDDDID